MTRQVPTFSEGNMLSGDAGASLLYWKKDISIIFMSQTTISSGPLPGRGPVLRTVPHVWGYRPGLCRSAAGAAVQRRRLPRHRLRHRRQKVATLNAGGSYIVRIPPAEIQRRRSAAFAPPTTTLRSREMDAVIICVPTPLNEHHEPDLSYVTGRSLASLRTCERAS